MDGLFTWYLSGPGCRAVKKISTAQALPADLRANALTALDSLPDGDRLCHGDFHPMNILLTRNGPVVIEWMTACSGSHWADVARTSLLLTIGPKGAGRQVSLLIRTAVRLYHRMYLNHYLKIVPDAISELKRWRPVIAAARLNEGIVPEREALLNIIQREWYDESFQEKK